MFFNQFIAAPYKKKEGALWQNANTAEVKVDGFNFESGSTWSYQDEETDTILKN